MYEHFEWGETERALVIELLEREVQDLPSEIHHTRSATVKEELHRRLEIVRNLLEHFRAAVPT